MALDDERRARLQAAKLSALVEATTGTTAPPRPGSFPGGAALVDGDRAWVLAGDGVVRALGPALAWARQQGAAELDVVVDPTDAAEHGERAAAVLARRAVQFSRPPRVWSVEGRTLVAVEPAAPESPLPVDPRALPFMDMIEAAGAEALVEHGFLVAEVAGLEVARVEVDADGPHLAIGVGRFDREAHTVISKDRPPQDTLAAVVRLVGDHRRPEAAPHPLNRLAAARWLRSRLVARPELVGASHLVPSSLLPPAPDLRTPWPAPAVGIDVEGNPLVVVASTGIDLDLVPAAADARLTSGLDARLVLAVPSRDAHPVTRALAAALAVPAEVVEVDA